MKILRGPMIAVGIAAAVCLSAADSKDVFRPKAAAGYPNSVRQEGVRIAAEAFSSAEQTKPPFGKLNPNEHGVLPVLVVIHNESKNTIRLEGLKVEYVDVHRRRIEDVPAKDVPYLKPPTRPTVKVQPLPPVFQRKKKNPLAAFEIESRAFVAKMLPPGESASGFFYFHSDHQPGAQIYITGIRNAASGQDLFYFEIALEPK
jgi:hypothetical protein